jgi:hypothetical protein
VSGLQDDAEMGRRTGTQFLGNVATAVLAGTDGGGDDGSRAVRW